MQFLCNLDDRTDFALPFRLDTLGAFFDTEIMLNILVGNESLRFAFHVKMS